jgi:hypothetical protein
VFQYSFENVIVTRKFSQTIVSPFEYDGDRDVTIGGYRYRYEESAWLGDLVAACVLENTAHLFADAIYDGTASTEIISQKARLLIGSRSSKKLTTTVPYVDRASYPFLSRFAL